ncbi:MAG: Hint domain-containing protein [bacterium]
MGISYQGFGDYDKFDGTFYGSGDAPFSNVHNDTDEDDLAEAGEHIQDYPYIVYVGTVTIGGQKYPVYEDTSISGYYVYYGGDAPAEPSEWPDPLTESIVNEAFCFCHGTLVKTADGSEQTVESLKIGDEIKLSDGDTARVLWIGVQAMDARFGFAERLAPIRIKAGALGDNVPNQDLTVSNDHALFVDGILAHAGALVNGRSIYRVPLNEFEDGKLTYYHIETEKHELILANNTPAETFIDNVSRQSFDNYQEYVDLYGEEREIDELPLPRAMSPRQLPKRIKARLAQRAIELGYVVKAAA